MPSFSLNPLPPFPPQAGSFPTGIQFQDELVNVGPPNPKYVSFNGPGVTASYDAANGRVNVEVSTGAVEVLDEGVVIASAVRRINFVGDGVTATVQSGLTDTVNVYVPGAEGGGGGGGSYPLFRAQKSSAQTSGTKILFQSVANYEFVGGIYDTGQSYYEVTESGRFVFFANCVISLVNTNYDPIPCSIAIIAWETGGNNPPSNLDDFGVSVLGASTGIALRKPESYMHVSPSVQVTSGVVSLMAGTRVGVFSVSLSSSNGSIWLRDLTETPALSVSLGSGTGYMSSFSAFRWWDPEGV